MPAKNFAGPYENMDFPAYRHQEYPKLVTIKDERGVESRVLVESQKEELAAIDQIVPVEDLKSVQDQLSNSQTVLSERDKEIAELKKQLAEAQAVPKERPDQKADAVQNIDDEGKIEAQAAPKAVESAPNPAPKTPELSQAVPKTPSINLPGTKK